MKSGLKSVLKQRRDSGLADTSDAETDYKTTSYEQSYTATSNDEEDVFSKDSETTQKSGEEKSILNIVNTSKKSVSDHSNPGIWESLKSKKEDSESVNSDIIKHNTDLYDPDKLNKGQYLEVMFKNDLIFDLDM